MYILLLAFLLQGIANQGPLTKPQTSSVPDTLRQKPTVPVPMTRHDRTSTVGDLSPDTTLHLQMEHEIGGQGMELGTLKEKVSDLTSKRDNIDRPDIDSLKTTRLYVSFAIAIIAPLLGFVVFRWKFFWKAILPHVRRDIFGYETKEGAES
jgi:hypothetical protein